MNYAITKQTITCVHEGKSYTVHETSPNYRSLRAALLAEDYELALSYLDVKKCIENWKSSNGSFVLRDGVILFKGYPVQDVISDRILGMINDDEDASPLLSFYEKLQQNPSARSVEQLYKFLEHCNIPLTPDGCFLAYKGVTEDYLDCHTRTLSNKPGVVHMMPRNKISDDPNHSCHFGFHVGALDYAKSFGKRVVICKVDPEHVVCVPYDSQSMKMRVCKYQVVADYVSPLKSTVDRTTVQSSVPPKAKSEKYTWDEVVKMNLDQLRKFASRELKITGTYDMRKSDILRLVRDRLDKKS